MTRRSVLFVVFIAVGLALVLAQSPLLRSREISLNDFERVGAFRGRASCDGGETHSVFYDVGAKTAFRAATRSGTIFYEMKTEPDVVRFFVQSGKTDSPREIDRDKWYALLKEKAPNLHNDIVGLDNNCIVNVTIIREQDQSL